MFSVSFYVAGRCQAPVDDACGRLWAARSVRGPRCGAFLRDTPAASIRRSLILTRVRVTSWVHDPVLAFYPSSHACARPPETVQSQSGHVCCGTFSVAVASGDPHEPYAPRA